MNNDSAINWDRVAHYDVGGKKFINPVAAWQEIIRNPAPYHFSIFDRAFSAYDWTQEPAESCSELGAARARQLREKYRWLRLWYSGGRDSHFILRCFLDNNIHLDEVVILHNSMMTVRDWEMKTLVYPLTVDLLRYTKTKIRVLTLTEKHYAQTFSAGWHENLQSEYNQPLWFQPTNFSRLFELDQSQFGKDDSRSGDIAIILGMEKPRILRDQGRWYTQMCDHHGFMHALDVKNNVEFFYVTPDMPALHAKQCWLAMRHIEQHHMHQSDQWLQQYVNCKLGPDLYDDYCMAIGRGPCTHPWLGLGQNKLSDQMGHSPRFQEFSRHAKDLGLSSFHNFHSVIDQWQNEMPQIFNDGDPLNGHVGFLSPRYYLKDTAQKLHDTKVDQ